MCRVTVYDERIIDFHISHHSMQSPWIAHQSGPLLEATSVLLIRFATIKQTISLSLEWWYNHELSLGTRGISKEQGCIWKIEEQQGL